MATLDAQIQQTLFEPGFDWRGYGQFARTMSVCGSAALDLLFPPHCVVCNVPLPPQISSVMCSTCTAAIRWIGDDRCLRCGDMVGTGSGGVEFCVSCKQHPPRFIKGVACAARYEEGPLRSLVLGLKFGGRAFQTKMMGRILSLRILKTGLLELAPNPVIVAAPMTRSGLFKRGFNQAAEIAEWVGVNLKLRVERRLLVKVRTTRPQATLSEKQRRVNLSGAFACRPKLAAKYAGANVLLIDDVITTGSTISECARTLHQFGIGRIVAASFARG